MNQTEILPAELHQLDLIAPVSALARMVRPGSARWAYSVLISDMAGASRRVPRLRAELLDRGAAAKPERLTRTVDSYIERSVGGVVTREPVFREHLPMLAAEPAVRPLRSLVDRAGSVDTLVELVKILDRCADLAEVPSVPDCDPAMVAPSWPTMRGLLGETAPPLRWSAPAVRGGGRPELAVLRPGILPVELVGVPRAAPPCTRDGGLIESDARLMAVRELVQHAAQVGQAVDREDVVQVLRWVVGPGRATLPVVGRGDLATEYAAAWVAQADRALGAASAEQVADQLITEGEAGEHAA